VSRPVYYLDTSAFLKLLVAEQHSAALRRELADAELWSSSLLDVEAHRAARRLGLPATAVAAALDVVSVFLPTETTYAAARSVGPDELRTLDALHLACALELGDDLGAVVTYDERLAAGCTGAGVAVLSPR
jgi:predicted nucleic acid-binding protein